MVHARVSIGLDQKQEKMQRKVIYIVLMKGSGLLLFAN